MGVLAKMVSWVQPSDLIPPKRRWRLLRMIGIDAQPTNIGAGCYFGSTRCSIGLRTFINRECFFDALEQITIGTDCAFGPRVTVLTSSHELGDAERRAGRLTSAPVTIEDGCWIGAGVTILPGVTIGRGTVIAAGALVADDCEPDSLYVGVPARRVRGLT